MRALFLAATAALLAIPGAASAASCNLLTDAKGDAALLIPQVPVKAAAYDVQSLDVATGAKSMVVVLRLGAGKPAAGDPVTSSGGTLRVSFSIAGVVHDFTRKYGADGAATDTATAGGATLAGAKATVEGSTLVWRVPRSSVAALRKKHAQLANFFVATSTPTLVHDYAPDDARPSRATYADRAKSCVKAP